MPHSFNSSIHTTKKKINPQPGISSVPKRRGTYHMSQITLTLPDGNQRNYEVGITARQVAIDIAPSLGKKAISATVNEVHWDLQWPIHDDCSIAINTMKETKPAIELVRHDLAHIMARAVQTIWPDVQVTIGPVIQDGWYYDFDRTEPFTPEDLGAIEKKMKEIINDREPVRTEIWDREQAIHYYQNNNEPYKVELIGTIPSNEPLRMYWRLAGFMSWTPFTTYWSSSS